MDLIERQDVLDALTATIEIKGAAYTRMRQAIKEIPARVAIDCDGDCDEKILNAQQEI